MSLPKIPPGTVGLMAAHVLHNFGIDTIEDILAKSYKIGYGDNRDKTFRQVALAEVARIAVDLAESVEKEMDSRVA